MKKFIFCFLMLIASIFMLVPEAKAQSLFEGDNLVKLDYSITTDFHRDDDFKGNCADFAHTLRIGGYIVLLVKVLLPLVIMIKASLNMVSLVTSGDAGEIKKQSKKLINSLIASIIIFFLPTLLYVMFGFISNFNENRTEDSKICNACIFKPYGSTCKNYAE